MSAFHIVKVPRVREDSPFFQQPACQFFFLKPWFLKPQGDIKSSFRADKRKTRRTIKKPNRRVHPSSYFGCIGGLELCAVAKKCRCRELNDLVYRQEGIRNHIECFHDFGDERRVST